eukprot:GFYU01005599.1.p1 GENE.GFYU01005599.1~~GFYU01005599.1.p1  ORF type:complete len:306 (+),score=23.35 GFYU01005599.1:83-1000(+)
MDAWVVREPRQKKPKKRPEPQKRFKQITIRDVKDVVSLTRLDRAKRNMMSTLKIGRISRDSTNDQISIVLTSAQAAVKGEQFDIFNTDDSSVNTLNREIRYLWTVNMTVDALVTTDMGKVVNLFRKFPGEEVADECSKLFKRWKERADESRFGPRLHVSQPSLGTAVTAKTCDKPLAATHGMTTFGGTTEARMSASNTNVTMATGGLVYPRTGDVTRDKFRQKLCELLREVEQMKEGRCQAQISPIVAEVERTVWTKAKKDSQSIFYKQLARIILKKIRSDAEVTWKLINAKVLPDAFVHAVQHG